MTLLLASILLAGPPATQWNYSDKSDACTFYQGAQEGDVIPIRAECNWAIPAAVLMDLLDDPTDHDELFSTLGEATRVSSKPGGPELIRQVHTPPLIASREVVCAVGTEEVPGGKRFTWAKVQDAITHYRGDLVPIAADRGFWEITSDGKGGAQVVYELHYHPGGGVPTFAMKWFQTSGISDVLDELQAAGKEAMKR